jgi:tetratricopeptide (TPR) repeat protein
VALDGARRICFDPPAMTSWMQWALLSAITGRPIASLLALVVFWWAADRFTFGVLPDPLRALGRARRRARLEAMIQANPSDRRARFELAQLLVEARRPGRALEVLRPNLEAGDDDVHTAFVYGVALARTGKLAEAERVLGIARAAEPGYRMGEVDLELGIVRLARGDADGAREALARLIEARPGTVQGRYHLARALEASGDAEGARRLRDEAWREYRAVPAFRRRADRPFAWRMKPWRPAAIALALLVAAALAVRAVGSSSPHRAASLRPPPAASFHD